MKLQERLDALTKFMGSEIYRDYLVELEERTEGARITVLVTPPDSVENHAACLKAHGALTTLACEKTIFEDLRSALKAEIDKIVEPDTNTAQQEE